MRRHVFLLVIINIGCWRWCDDGASCAWWKFKKWDVVLNNVCFGVWFLSRATSPHRSLKEEKHFDIHSAPNTEREGGFYAAAWRWSPLIPGSLTVQIGAAPSSPEPPEDSPQRLFCPGLGPSLPSGPFTRRKSAPLYHIPDVLPLCDHRRSKRHWASVFETVQESWCCAEMS